MPNVLIAKATAALQESVASIINCDENDATKREALVETFAQFQNYMERNGVMAKSLDGDGIAKAHEHRGPHELAASLVQHLHDRLDRHRERHGYQKSAKEQPMDTLHSIMKDGGIAGVCAAVVSKGSTTISEHELVEAVSKVAAERYPELSSAQAFAKIYSDGGEEGRVLRSAINVAKLSVFDLAPVYVGGVDATHEAIDATEQSEAYAQLEAMASKLRASSPWLSAEQAFAKVFEDPRNGKLAAKAHVRPSPTTSYEFPR
jgi:hypothetical protein